MDLEKVQQASYRGAFFFVSRTTTAGSRKDSKKELVGNDRQVIEDLGLRQRVFTINGFIAARRSLGGQVLRTYEQVRDELLDALESGEGPGVLVHPFYGERQGIVARTWSLEESMKSLGDSRITMTFEVSNEDEDGIPRQEPTTLAGVESENQAVINTVLEDIRGKFDENLEQIQPPRFAITSGKFRDNFSKAVDKVGKITDAIDEATRPLAQLATEIDAYNQELSQITADVISLVQTPADLASSLTNIMATVTNLFNSPLTALKAFGRLFDFGDDDVSVQGTTAARIESNQNNDVLNSCVQLQALGYAYENSAATEFQTVDEIDAAAELLEVQFQKMIAAEQLSPDQVDALNTLRTTALEFFNAQRLTKPNIIEVRTAATSAARLSYQYYGTSELAETISKLNDLADPAIIPPGTVKILEFIA